MTKINESPEWVDEIDLIARRDKVEGGKDGKINIQASQLASRTAFLKGQLDSLGSEAQESIKAKTDFIRGGELSSSREEIVYGNLRLVWTGDFPKTVPPESTPENTGGVGPGAWAYTSDAGIRADLGRRGASISADERSGNIQQALHFMTVRQCGAKGDGVTVEDAAFSEAALTSPASNIAGVGKSENIPRPESTIVYINDGTYLLSDYIDVGNRDVTWVASHGAEIINPKYLNGRLYRPGRQNNLYPHGSAGNACGFSVRLQKVGEDSTDGPEILGITTPARLATYPDRDIAAFYAEAKMPPALATLTGTTFTATSISFATTLSTAQRRLIRRGMIIDTAGTRYSGVVTGWSTDFKTITVTGWYLYNGGGGTSTPPGGLTAVLNAYTKGWGQNINAQLDPNSFADYCVAAEYSVVNNKGYNVNCWVADFINLGSFKLGTLINLRGNAAGALYGAQISNVETAININTVSNAYFIGVDNNDVQMPFGKNTQTFGKANTASTQTIAFRTSGKGTGTADASITVSGGDATTLATMNLVAAAVITRNVYPHADAADDLGFAGNGRFRNAYLANAPIVTSDEVAKTGSEDGSVSSVDIPDAVLDAWETVNFAMYKMRDAVADKGWSGARWHFGIIAQRVQDAFEAAGLDAMDYGIIGYDEWEAQDAVYSEAVPEVNQPEIDMPERHVDAVTDEEGNVIKEAYVTPAHHQDAVYIPARPAALVTPAFAAGSCYSLRYEECLVLEAACMRRRMDRLTQLLSGGSL